VVITGPSGVGKTTVTERLKEGDQQRQTHGFDPRFHIAVTATTRPPRPREIDSVDYYFVSSERFREMLESGELLEHAEVYGNLYGVPKEPLRQALAEGHTVIVRTDVQGARYIKSVYPQTVTIFLAPPTWEELERRLRGRASDGEEQVTRRLQTALDEIATASEFDHVVVNETVEDTAKRIEQIIEKERLRERPLLEL